MQISDLRQQLSVLLNNAYAPYSKFPVACLIQTTKGSWYSGVNVENAAFPLGRCAEQAAVGAMVTAGEQEIAAVYILSNASPAATPCGGCRQILAEFATPETPVYCLNMEGEQVYTMQQLLPFGFKL